MDGTPISASVRKHQNRRINSIPALFSGYAPGLASDLLKMDRRPAMARCAGNRKRR